MRLQFKVQDYQTAAVDAVLECFAGQPKSSGVEYRVDPGRRAPASGTRVDTAYVPIASGGQGELVLSGVQSKLAEPEAPDSGFRNAEIALPKDVLLGNIRAVQSGVPLLTRSTSLIDSGAARGAPNLDVDMETGTGKTYVYIKTMMELNRRYGWSKFIVVVPSIAIREGVLKSFAVTADHFQQEYGTKPRAFVYNSSRLHEVEAFSSSPGVQVMIINIQAFNATGKDARRIYEALDDFQSRRPIDVIAANRPIVIIDEPQKIGAAKSLEALSRFNALAVLRYSATHKVQHNLVHRLDAVDAYNDKLVKRIAVRGITVKGLAGSTAYLYVDTIEVRKAAKPRARVEVEVQGKTAITRKVIWVEQGTNLHDRSNGIEAYKGLFVTDIDAVRDVIELSNGDVVVAGQLADRDVTEQTKRRIQIREVIHAHLEKERQLFLQGIKVLSLFFIDEVAKYRDYDREDTKGEYQRVFEEEYARAVDDFLQALDLTGEDAAYRAHLESIDVSTTHAGYFSIDKKGRQVDPSVAKSGDEKGNSTDTSAYDLILKEKERLLSFAEPVRFLFSHSALREGWDNPNVFVMGMLKKSDNTISRRQEIGRGLRLAVDQHGNRQDKEAVGEERVHEINELTVVTDESYTDFVAGLQKEISEATSNRPRKADEKYFLGKIVTVDGADSLIEKSLAREIYKYLLKNDYIANDDTITDRYREAREADILAPASGELASLIQSIVPLIDVVARGLPDPTDGRKPKKIPLNDANFRRKEFQELWKRINHKAVYRVEFDSDELIRKCVDHLNKNLRVAPLQYVVESGLQSSTLDADDLHSGEGFRRSASSTHTEISAHSRVKYDLLGEIAEKTQLTRRTCAAILQGISVATFSLYRANPEHFITETARLINEQKATVIIEHLTYDTLDDRFESSIFTQNQTKQDFSRASRKLDKHVYEYVVTDSGVERDFVNLLDTSNEVAVYAKLPRGFFIPTPLGPYNPDWAIAFHEGRVKHIYFVAETKGSLSTLQLKGAEAGKIECARKFFASLREHHVDDVTYDVVDSYERLLEIVGKGN
ncbi:type III restriction-modification system endonuclease [Cellulomonas wangsupingiae]|uniref:DEAD/DEAH box helicase family protein n=1 Tax=Cellulomonas wangsupingiae TaxID=2968085 RepID=A0ABY5K546_9CELL|nr:DEAD/DEAH box helicase family protein [Cellulomonas wangsupingiae]MCC2333616.1 DEAD/DEAH box helicase family protein [Cellulomonas wangsupingiae]UUI64884.1 DEAD/DEAH box helicase family protein [Cellulomonas wangsupingiae]